MRKNYLKYHLYLLTGLILILLFYNACKKENKIYVQDISVKNPYDDIDYGEHPEDIPVDSSSFLGLHKYIFSTTCAVPGCHDGSFEPDFRTVQSAYSTLVYHPPLKNNTANEFKYRVQPGNYLKSWLHERITTNDPILGRMPLYDEPLSFREITLIRNWISNGAPDIFNHSPVLSNPEPAFFGILAYLNDTSGMRLDTTRENVISAMILPQNSTVDIWFGLYDSDEEEPYIPAANFTYNKIKIAPDLFEFGSVPEKSLSVLPATSPFFGPIPTSADPNQKAPYYHHITINTANYPVGQANYMRVYVQDADHTTPTELPDDGTQFYLLTYFSFVVR